ncbi:MAG: hypothetical protein HQL06_13835 [Nitrospirae bacterium]|nr:hypothetical protein [Nitrospirota bacterium]
MNCDKVRLYTSEYLNEELDVIVSHEIEQHINDCDDCREYMEKMQFTISMLDTLKVTPENVKDIPPISAGFEQRVLKQIQAMQSEESWWVRVVNAIRSFVDHILGADIKYMIPAGLTAVAVLLIVVKFALYQHPESVSSLSEMTSKIYSGQIMERYPIDKGYYGFSGTPTKRRICFIGGIYTTDLSIYLSQEDKGKAIETINSLIENFKGLDEFSKQVDLYKRIKVKIEVSGSLKQLRSKLDEQAITDGTDMAHFRFGQWVEAGRLASKTNNEAFFKEGDVEYFKKSLKKEDIPEGIVTALDGINKIIKDRPIKDFAKLNKLFEDMIALM